MRGLKRESSARGVAVDESSPRLQSRSGSALGAMAAVLAVGLLARSTNAGPVFSVTWQGPPKGMPSFFGPPITEGDLLIPGTPTFAPMPGPLPPPIVLISAGFGPPGPGLALPMGPAAIGVPAGMPGFVEVDAISFGTDFPIRPTMTAGDLIWAFSVDEFTVGVPGSPLPPNVFTMGAAGAAEASGDIFVDVATGPGPICVPIAATLGNTSLLDCNGIAPPAGFPGLMGPPGLEPNPPAAGLPDFGADIDALDLDPPAGPSFIPGVPGVAFPIYYSLDFPIAGIDPNSGSAGANGGFFGSDVLVCMAPGAPPAVYAPGAMLGIPGAANDLDGLILWENGIPGYQPPTVPYSWVPGVVPIPTDMLFFSVRPGSAIIGVPDGLCGTPISAADILWGPAAPGLPPRKWIAAGQLGLAPGDNIDALDLLGDCNHNGKPDNLEIAMGFEPDINGNGRPDSCDCLADSDGNGIVDINDLVKVITSWGPCVGCPPAHCAGDVNWDCVIDINDLVKVITAWGPCPI